MSGEAVLICVAWPYANGPLHLGHVAGCYLPPDIQARFERARGNDVLMVSGSDEHGTPITLTAEQEGISPQQVVDRFHAVNTEALNQLGVSFQPKGELSLDAPGIFDRTSDLDHHRLVQENFKAMYEGGLLEERSSLQLYEVRKEGGRFLPDRYVEGICPACQVEGARGDQCDECGATYEADELVNPISRLNPKAELEIRETKHLFFRLDKFQSALEQFASVHESSWKPLVRSITRDWLKMGLKPRAVTRDISWGIPVPIDGEDWSGKRIYVWFEAFQGYLTATQLWAKRVGEPDAWKKWWLKPADDAKQPRHFYFLGKDNVPFHTIFWPAVLMALNQVNRKENGDRNLADVKEGELLLPTDIPAMEWLMLDGGQFSKSKKHAVWLPAYLSRFDPDPLRYYLTVNMPDSRNSDFTWSDFVEKVNNELIANYGNLANRILTLSHRLSKTDPTSDPNPLTRYDSESKLPLEVVEAHSRITEHLNSSRYRPALREIMAISAYGNRMLQEATPWKHLKPNEEGGRIKGLSSLAIGQRLLRTLAIWTHPFMPLQANRLLKMLGIGQKVADIEWDDALDWNTPLPPLPTKKPQTLFEQMDLEAILAQETQLAEIDSVERDQPVHSIKGGGKKKSNPKKKVKTMEDETTDVIEYPHFSAVDLRAAKVLAVEEHPNADKLYVLKLDDGSGEERTICAGLKGRVPPEEIEGKTIVIVANLAPRKMRGIVSNGMLLAADDAEGGVKLATIEGDVPPGSQLH